MANIQIFNRAALWYDLSHRSKKNMGNFSPDWAPEDQTGSLRRGCFFAKWMCKNNLFPEF